MAAVVQQAIAGSVQRLLAHDPIVRLDLGSGRRPPGPGEHPPAAQRPPHVRGRRRRRVGRSPEGRSWRWLADALGAVRDVDVLGIRFRRDLEPWTRPTRQAGRPAPPPGRAGRERLAALQRTSRATGTSTCSTGSSAPRATPPAARRASDRRRRCSPRSSPSRGRSCARRPAARQASPADEELHALRIKAKRARYAAEGRGASHPEAGAFATAVAELQDVLGEQHDAVVAEEWLRDADRGGRSGASRPSWPACSSGRAAPGQDGGVAGRVGECRRQEAAGVDGRRHG